MNISYLKKFLAVFILAFMITLVILVATMPNGNKTVEIDDEELETDVDDSQVHVVIIPDSSTSDPMNDETSESENNEPFAAEEYENNSLDSLTLTDEELPENLRQIAEQYNVIGMSLIVIKNYEVSASYSYGYRDRENSSPFTSSTVMRAAAASELISSIGIMKLYEDGMIDLDMPVGDYLGYTVENPRVGQEITLRQIMTHTAGISDYGAYNQVVYGEIEYQPLIEMLNGKYLSTNFFEMYPGYEYVFSNFGAALLAPVVSTVSNKMFNTYMTEILFEPLGLDAGYSSKNITKRDNIALIYRQGTLNYTLDEMDEFANELAEIEPVDNYRTSHGNLFISAGDLSRIAIMLINKGVVDNVRILEEATVDEMLSTEAVGTLHKNVSKGLGITSETGLVQGRTLYGHQGAAYGGTVEIFFDPTDGSGIVLVVNGSLNTADDSAFSLMGKAFIKEIYKQ